MIKSKLGRLLIVDDEVELVTPLCGLLSEWGYEAVGYTSSKDALETLKEQDFDLLLSDLVMPEIDGIELMKAAMEIDPHLVCIIISGKGTIQTAVEAMKVGAFDYIVKPLDWKLLKLILFRAMEVRRLREAEEKYRSIVEDYQTELICRFLPDRTLTFVNKAYCRYFDKRCEELIGHSFMPLIPDEDHEKLEKHIASLNLENPVATIEHRVFTPSGEIHWQKWTNRAIFDHHDNIIEFQSVGGDVTDRKHAEDALRGSEERFRAIFNTAQDCIFIKDCSLKYLQVNPSMERLFGVPASELIGKTDEELFGEEIAKHIREIDSRVLKGEIVEGEHTKPIKGILRTFHHIKVPVHNPKGEIIGLCGIARDIIERKQMEEALRVSAQEWRTTFDAISDAVCLLDMKGRIQRCNTAMTKLLGKPFSEIVGRTWEHIHGPSGSIPIKGHSLIVRMQKTKRREAMVLPVHDRWLNVTVDPVLDETGNIAGAVHVITDITERKLAEEELESSREQLRNLSAHLQSAREEERRHIAREIHDELGQALTALKMDISWLINKLPESEKPLIKKTNPHSISKCNTRRSDFKWCFKPQTLPGAIVDQ
jgi:PAS domain S-box-containing protein